jgi:DNA-binding transcriptional MerR regulator/methylmalonyl-CoA mutase cobalamin-binding subunit
MLRAQRCSGDAATMKPILSIKVVARQTGLSEQLIRMWEKRYNVVQPQRAPNNRRLYTEEDVERLRLLREATQAGHSISQIAQASVAQLQRLVQDAAPTPAPAEQARPQRPATEAVDEFTQQAIAAISNLDRRGLTTALDGAAVELGSPAVLQKFVSPLAGRIGDLWRAGELNIAHEHFATEAITDFLNAFARPFSEDATAPHLVLATPTGQHHELGAIVVAAAARSHGWRTTYLGASLPVEELAGALARLRPRAVGLSIVYPPDDAALQRDLRRLHELLPDDCALLIGGQSAGSYVELAGELHAIYVRALADLFPVLDRLQRSRLRAAK